MKREVGIAVAVTTGVLATLLLRRRARAGDAEAGGTADPRASELRRKLAQARETAADEEDFQAAGMGGETIVEDEASGDVEESRRRLHAEARATLEEMRRAEERGER